MWRLALCALLWAVPVLAQTPTITPNAANDCCIEQGPFGNVGCNDSACEACICVGDGIQNDPGCCGIAGQFPNQWDYQCSLEARGLHNLPPDQTANCGSSCACAAAFFTATPTITPTITQTPTRTSTPTITPTVPSSGPPQEDVFIGAFPTATSTRTFTPTKTPTKTPTATVTPTGTVTGTRTPNAFLTGCCECPGCCGDLTAAGQVTQADVDACAAALFGDYWSATACDCNGDRQITAGDLTQVQQNFAQQDCAPITQCAPPFSGLCGQGCILINNASCQPLTPTPTGTPPTPTPT